MRRILYVVDLGRRIFLWLTASQGQAAYRILIPREKMMSDPELAPLIEENVVTRWIAPRRHIIAYPISNKTIYNISTAHPDEHLVQESWTSKGSKTDMLKTWSDYCPRIQKMLHMGESRPSHTSPVVG